MTPIVREIRPQPQRHLNLLQTNRAIALPLAPIPYDPI